MNRDAGSTVCRFRRPGPLEKTGDCRKHLFVQNNGKIGVHNIHRKCSPQCPELNLKDLQLQKQAGSRPQGIG